MELKVRVFEGKNLDEVKKTALEELNLEESQIMYQYEEKKGKLFKSGSVILKVSTLEDVADYIKENLKELVNNLGIEVNLESQIREQQINIKMYSDKNSILIGKNGQTLTALQNILRQIVYKEIGTYPYILLDVENYKEKKLGNIERMAKRIAREVSKTKIDAILDDMNSYERRIIHNVLSTYKNITTISEGEEPHRHVIIKYKED